MSKHLTLPTHPPASAAFYYGGMSPNEVAALRAQAERIRKLNRTLTATVIELGRELIDVKARLPHGQFGPWVEAECGFTIRTAENYIKAAKFVVGKNETAVSHLAPAVVYQLAAKSAPAALVDRVAKGEVVTDGEVKAELAKAKREKQDHPPEIKKSEPKIESSKPATVTTLAEMGKQVRAMSAPTKPDTVAVADPLVIDREDEIEATPWFASKIKSILDGSLENDEAKSALALAEFKAACAEFLPQLTIKDLETAQNIFGVIPDLKFEVEHAQFEAKYAAAEAKRIKWEASHPEQAKNKAREQAQSDAMECDMGDAKAEARENEERWGDRKDEWIDEWIADNWGAEEEAKFEKIFQERWAHDHPTTETSTKAEATTPPENKTNSTDADYPDLPACLDRRQPSPSKAEALS